MKIFAETERLILREIVPADADGLYAVDSDPEVNRYLGNKPVKDIGQIREIIAFIRQQYVDNGIGRWAVIEKTKNIFIGWSGLKLVKDTINGHSNYYDLGYRFNRNYWNNGYASESAIAAVKYGFDALGAKDIYGMADAENVASGKVLEKAGLKYIETFDFDGVPHNWYRIIDGQLREV